ncbi:beta-glucanosyltransferase Gel1 [Zalerion maritima]|uniref:1,3-beta-glucanosyltransferase n=1 Tax=Zalerion maritima TaxID=339359 RepID=A0AAD5RR39_9PEZI|nr:beta-glucanosyltransferase Gel1 [Zalerion maritima]
MRTSTLATAALAIGLASATPTKSTPAEKVKRASAPAVSASGNAFWADGERFYIRGMDYQPGGESDSGDPLSDETICDRDVAAFADLGINTIRVYIVDNSADHDYCMNKLAENGIYLILDANNPKYSINRAEPGPSYNAMYLQSVFATIDAFAKYDNTLGFFSGNEVINDEEDFDTTLAAPYVKATTRDMRKYIKAQGYRSIPVGYSAADVSSNRIQTAEYFNCGTDEERSDFFAFNDYSWCKSDFKTAGWDVKVKNFTDYGLPIFLSEWGCTANGRDFNELSALNSDKMTGVYSGGLMYEYTVEDSGYGIAKVVSDSEIETTDEYDLFKEALAEYPAPTGDGGAASTTHAVDCPPQSDDWSVDPDSSLPAMPSGAEKYLENGAGDGPGLTGSGSQTAGSDAEAEDNGDSSSSDEEDENASGRIQPGRVAVTGFVAAVVAGGFALL